MREHAQAVHFGHLWKKLASMHNGLIVMFCLMLLTVGLHEMIFIFVYDKYMLSVTYS